MLDFLAMDGYAKFVWSSFGVSVLMLVVTVWLTKRNLAATRQRVLRYITAMEGKQQ
jgi:heme exporter protein CcmD